MTFQPTTTKHKPDPVIAINAYLSMAFDCLERAGGKLDPATWSAIGAVYVDQQLFRACAYIAKARALAIHSHGVPDLIDGGDRDPWHDDDVVELAPEAAGTDDKGGAA